MKTENRYKKIEQLLNKNGSLSVKELAEIVDVSEATIRRDLAEMEKRSVISRMWGGAKILEESASNNVVNYSDEYLLRFSKNTHFKEELAKKACSLIKDGSTIFIDAGSTTSKMFDYLEGNDITVVTNSLYNIDKLASKNIQTFLPRGYVNFGSATILSMETTQDVASLNYDIVFLGTSGIDKQTGFTTRDIFDFNLKSTLISRASKTYIVSDSSKFGLRRPYTFANINDCTLITDKHPDFDIKDIIVI